MRLVYLNVKPQKADEQNPDNWKFIGQLGMSVAAIRDTATKTDHWFYEEKHVHMLINTTIKS